MKSRVVKTVDLEQHEKDALKTISKISCSCIDDCDYCPFYNKQYFAGETHLICVKQSCQDICEKLNIEYDEDYS